MQCLVLCVHTMYCTRAARHSDPRPKVQNMSGTLLELTLLVYDRASACFSKFKQTQEYWPVAGAALSLGSIGLTFSVSHPS